MYKSAFESRDDLKKYGNNALLLFSLILRYSIEDIDTVAAEALTDGNDDKKADLVFVNNDEGYAVIAQGYMSQNLTKTSAPSNKACDLNTAVGWLLNRPTEDLPTDIKSAAIQLRNAIEANEIKEIEIWYVHNLPESENVKNELITVEKSAISILHHNFPKKNISIKSLEVGKNTLNEWYKSLQTPILVNDEIKLKIKGGFQLAGEDWESFSTAIQSSDLYELFQKHDKKMFSANIRDYLGSIKSDSNINNGIKSTAETEPNQFYVYNNGITVITHDFVPARNRKSITLSGISIVNGAQTTGSIGTLSTTPSSTCFVPTRIIKCTNQSIIQNIVKYNNSQNKITATDFRSNDPIQDRLRKEFATIKDAEYYGGRRGGSNDAIRRPASLIPSDTAAQALAAFHLHPNVAYNKKSDIWKSDNLYSTFFNEKTTAKHIIFVYSLLLKIHEIKLALTLKQKANKTLLESERECLNFLKNRGANYMLMTAISYSLESIVGQSIPNKFRVSFGDSCGISSAKAKWGPVVEAVIAFSEQLILPTKSSLKKADDVDEAKIKFRSLVEATKNANKAIYSSFGSSVVIHI